MDARRDGRDKEGVYTATVDLRPNGDLTPLQWTSTGASHYTEIDEDVETPNTADRISSGTAAQVDVVALTDKPVDYDTSNTVELKVHGKATADFGFTAELRKADETILATVTFTKGVDTVYVTRTSGPVAASLSGAEVDGLKIRFVST